jgi:hypothetical protein
MQIFFWRVWNAVLFGAVVMAVPSAGQPVGAETPDAQVQN